MATDSTSLRTQRPDIVQKIDYTLTPQYYEHKAYEDKLAILVCQIKIWKANGTDWFSIPSANQCLTIRECESIEISDSSKELINKATVRFPRGTVISLSSKKDKSVKSGSKEDSTEKTNNLKDTNNDGDVTSTSTAQFSDDGVSTTSMAVNYDDKGLIDFNRSKTEKALLSPNDVAVGNRIEIRLGYAYSETEFNKMNVADNDPNMNVAFTGFITAISVDTPLELECTNMAHVLTAVSTPNISEKATLFVKDFLDDNGKYHLLKGTGIPLANSSKNSIISVSGGSISNNLTVADVLSEWNKSGVLCIMETKSDGSVQLRVGLTYYAGKGGGKLPNNDKKYITYNGGNNSVMLIQFDWDVAQDKLSLKRNDKKYLAVEAQGRTKDNQFFKLTIRKNPNPDDEGWMIDSDGQFQVINRRKVKNRKKMKYVNGTFSTKMIEGHLTDPVKLDKYNVIHYLSTKIGITEEELIEEAKQYWANYNPNGISGSLVIFGDLFIKPTDIVGLVDVRQPEKNGYYYVESVNTTFGINGYRRELKIPFKIASFAKPVQIIK
ncbi:hypothetical protein [Phocaeicola dorei]|jgi:hypothetical protein|uniref:hypothetical protein n=1 Tax=Phocaeicola dorei TaxID=357276 RepID=UPI001BDF5844|nr:hypothetical protein [Phocaeicola dorei]MBT1285846.1 hypothetical protein [Phocaeicola dorei]MBT1289714.1 hypothetical protein [Phocaeicola dorei]